MAKVTARKETGKLVVDFTHRGVRCREQTALSDTVANRRTLDSIVRRIKAAQRDGTFRYADFFPASPLAARFASKATDKAVRQEALGARGESATSSAATPALRTLADQWLTNHAVEWRRSHIRVLRSTIDGHLVPHFGDKPIGQITKADILAFRNKLAESAGRSGEGLSAKRINGILAPLKQMLAEAAETYGFISPALNLRPLKVRKSDVQPFTLSEVQLLLQTARRDYRNYFTVRFFTGMRTGEVHGLK
jgi:integrase